MYVLVLDQRLILHRRNLAHTGLLLYNTTIGSIYFVRIKNKTIQRRYVSNLEHGLTSDVGPPLLQVQAELITNCIHYNAQSILLYMAS